MKTSAESTHTTPSTKTNLTLYWVLSYGLILLNLSPLLTGQGLDVKSMTFEIIVYLTYGVLYLIPAFILVAFFNKLFTKKVWLIYTVGITAVSIIQVYLFADQTIFRMFNFHINGFVWNLVTTPGGIASLGADTTTMLSFTGVIGGLISLQTSALLISHKVSRRHGK
jgi:membrane-anchored protein YejM (alkaline phosphatase superfamily)